jgi:hypothetical protein
MSLDACETPESGTAAPSACSEAKGLAALTSEHKLDLWASILG